ncbi:MAG: SpoIID/LytB domain-containing protein [Schleiferiaceae bacterium]|nr:SpoIID/LytB domain-containing protein [Schleiferiaceae bacterium]MDR9441659.1 SpoIID/LytB domain-containing protein [Schleiferiaceae bacterium]
MRKLFFIALLLGTWTVTGQDDTAVRVRLFARYKLEQVSLSLDTGRYYVLALNQQNRLIDTVYDVFAADSLRTYYLRYGAEGIRLSRGQEFLGSYKRLQFRSKDPRRQFRISAHGQNRSYYGNLHFWGKGSELLVVNEVALPRYVAGVVESEAGHVGLLAFFKAQAVLARTYAMRQRDRIQEQGYILTDGVSSQVYRNKAHYTYAAKIDSAVEATRDTILLLEEDEPILSVFHANSGGYTLNSEDVWLEPVPYLRSRPDSFSVGGDSYRWERRITTERFFRYFANRLGVENNLDLQKALLNFDQRERRSHFRYQGRSLKLTEFRRDFGLRSTFFQVEKEGAYIILKGWGYGHGVGLSQDGAIEMARKGYSYRAILRFYYADVRLGSIHQLGS